jgi:hypothetical protein
MNVREPRTSVAIWRRLDRPGMEVCRVIEDDSGIRFEGSVLLVNQGVPWQIAYTIRCDRRWLTREVDVRATGTTPHAISMRVDGDGHWWVNDVARDDLHLCIDVDLGFSPSTNTLPIRRLRLDLDRAATIQAAWVEFPSFAVQRVAQRYTRVGDRAYRYDNLPTGFQADIAVDETGLVTGYPPGWARMEGDDSGSPLFAPAPAETSTDTTSLYAGLIGSWAVDVVDYDARGSRYTSTGEWHFAWVLEGRAVQDVFIVPGRDRRFDLRTVQRNRYGTTLRFCDPATGLWRITWINPVTGAVNRLTARKKGMAVVQVGTDDDGTMRRWTFVEITRDRFHWVGEESDDGGSTWRKGAEFFGRRTSFAPMR